MLYIWWRGSIETLGIYVYINICKQILKQKQTQSSEAASIGWGKSGLGKAWGKIFFLFCPWLLEDPWKSREPPKPSSVSLATHRVLFFALWRVIRDSHGDGGKNRIDTPPPALGWCSTESCSLSRLQEDEALGMKCHGQHRLPVSRTLRYSPGYVPTICWDFRVPCHWTPLRMELASSCYHQGRCLPVTKKS